VLIRRDPDAVGEILARGGGGAVGGGGASGTAAPSLPAGLSRATSTTGVGVDAGSPLGPFTVSRVVKPHAALSAAYAANLRHAITAATAGRHDVVEAMGASADSFYSSQGETGLGGGVCGASANTLSCRQAVCTRGSRPPSAHTQTAWSWFRRHSSRLRLLTVARPAPIRH